MWQILPKPLLFFWHVYLHSLIMWHPLKWYLFCYWLWPLSIQQWYKNSNSYAFACPISEACNILHCFHQYPLVYIQGYISQMFIPNGGHIPLMLSRINITPNVSLTWYLLATSKFIYMFVCLQCHPDESFFRLLLPICLYPFLFQTWCNWHIPHPYLYFSPQAPQIHIIWGNVPRPLCFTSG